MTLLAIAPLELTFFGVTLLLGFCFGFVLESSGFGDCRRLAAQFYFREVRVLQVMFTAIVVCMLLLLWSSALGLLDLEAIFVNPTYLASGILGGLVLGFGFIIGGYCPGTSIVSASTLKIDGALFLGGVGLGSLVFGEVADGFRVFYETAGFRGRLTIPEWLGLPAGVVAILIVGMAAFMFWGGELLERIFGGAQRPPERKFWRPAVKGGAALAVILLVAALLLPVVGQPTIEDRIARLQPELDAKLDSGDVLIDPTELLGLMHSYVQGKQGRVRLEMLDVRSESDFNLFHLVDARRTTLHGLKNSEGRTLAGERFQKTIKIVLSNDSSAAAEGWKALRAHGVRDCYVLEGGVNLWLDRFKDGRLDARPEDAGGAMRHSFENALGARYPFAKPPLQAYEALKGREIQYKVQPVVAAPAASAGCG
ncbi:MAG: YeeE/YedE thiosulfate transporter family protein [Planctomycetota bacterium]|jgi:rhodanese-related sulfurtransferase